MIDTRTPLDRFLDALMVAAIHLIEKVVDWFTVVAAGTEATA